MEIHQKTGWTGKYPLLVIAHRGFSGAAPENTMAAFKKAMATGADMVELDVHLSRDGEVVVTHDDTLNRCTNGSGLVSDCTLKELKGFDAGSWFGEEFRGEKIPTLEEVLTLIKGKILLNIEIKIGRLGQYNIEDLTDRALAKVEELGLLNQVLFSSFNPSALKRIEKKNNLALLALLLNYPWTDSKNVLAGDFSVLNCARNTLTRQMIVSARERGFELNVWTVDEEGEMERFIEMQIHGIFTNYPDRLIRILQTRSLKDHKISN